MSASSIVSNVRACRAAAKLSQAELAVQVGISRQALSAIEAGRQVPSTAVALRLARVLGCGVEDLFRLPGGAVVRAEAASVLREAQRVVLGRVEGRLVAHACCRDAQAADGVTLGAASEGGSVAVELVSDPSSVDANVLIAGCAPLLGVVAERLGRRYRDVRAAWIPATSAQALDLLQRGVVHLAGAHLAEAFDVRPHEEAAQRAIPDQRAALVHVACWRQGLVVASGNPLGVCAGGGLLRPELRYTTRDPGAAAQRLLERALRDAGDADGAMLATARRSADHAEVAQHVRWGLADVGVAIEAVALAHGLGFVPLMEERFDLIAPAARLDQPAVARVVELIDQPALRVEARGMVGYDLSRAGQVATVAARAEARVEGGE